MLEDFSRSVANLTHELKTPLHSMLAVASVLKSEVDGPLNEEQRRQVDIIIRNGEHLLDLITDLLQYSSTSTQTRALNVRKLRIRDFFNELVQSLVPLAAKTGVTIESDLEKLSPVFASDQVLLRRIVGNLLSNAIKFSPDGGVVALFAASRQNDSLEIQISDSGIGMPREVRDSIFREFYQADSSDSRRFGGVGLGLSLVKSSLDRLGGKIEVQSEPQQGSLFTITLPSLDDRLAKHRIIVLDADEAIRLSLREVFSAEGYESFFIENESAALAEIAKFNPDLVILDVKPSGSVAFSLLEQIRSSTWGGKTPIIMMSALDEPEERAKGLRLGANDFVLKPFDLRELLARVASQLMRRET